MTLPVFISQPALLDLFDINDYYLVEVDDKTAAKIIDRLETAVNSLANLCERGSIPKELLNLGIRQYRRNILFIVVMISTYSAVTCFIFYQFLLE